MGDRAQSPNAIGSTVPPFSGAAAGAAGELIDSVSLNLAADSTATAQPPVYATLMTLPLTTTLASSYLFILFTGCVRVTGPSAVNNAPNFRFRLNGALLTPGDGATVNMPRNQFMPVAYSRRIVVAAGLQTVVVEWAYFGPAGQTMDISPVTLPDLCHAHLLLQEQAS